MGVYVAEINGRGIAGVNAEQISDAEGFVKNPAIGSELMVLENDGAPLWDGDGAISMRTAFRKGRLRGKISWIKQHAKTRWMLTNPNPGCVS
jgi:hypothetical protein